MPDERFITDNIVPVDGLSAIIINPGTGAVVGANEDDAETNIKAFIADLGFPCDYQRIPDADYGNGRFAFDLRANNVRCQVQMPGLPLERVRWTDGADPWEFPRLYVDDGSWLWGFGLNVARRFIWDDEGDE